MARSFRFSFPGLLLALACSSSSVQPFRTIPPAWSGPPAARQIAQLSYGGGGVLQYQAAPVRQTTVHVVSSAAGAALFNGPLRLTPDFAAIDSFDVSEERKEVVFSAKRQNGFDAGLVSIDGSPVHWIPEDPADEVAVQWAPRGNKVSFVVRANGGDLVRTVHVPTATPLASEFENGYVHALAWEPSGARYAVAWSSVDASDRVEVMRYGGEERKVVVQPAEKLDVTIDAIAGVMVLRPSSLRYNEKVPLVVWLADQPYAWDDSRAALQRHARVACAVTKTAPGEAFWSAVRDVTWLDASRIYVVGAAAPEGATAIISDASVPDGRYREEPRLIRVPPAVVKSFAAGYIPQALERNAPIHGSQ